MPLPRVVTPQRPPPPRVDPSCCRCCREGIATSAHCLPIMGRDRRRTAEARNPNPARRPCGPTPARDPHPACSPAQPAQFSSYFSSPRDALTPPHSQPRRFISATRGVRTTGRAALHGALRPLGPVCAWRGCRFISGARFGELSWPHPRRSPRALLVRAFTPWWWWWVERVRCAASRAAKSLQRSRTAPRKMRSRHPVRRLAPDIGAAWACLGVVGLLGRARCVCHRRMLRCSRGRDDDRQSV
jgi:hypothetical protein